MAKKRFNVVWTAHYKCTATVEAENESAAMEACYDLDDGKFKREYEGSSDWSAQPEEEDEQ